MDEFEQAMSGMRQAFIDLDGDGRPDGVSPGIADELARSQPPNQLARSGRMPTGEARGYQPTRGEDVEFDLRQRGRLGNAMAPIARATLDYGGIPAEMATAVAMQPVRAGNAMADAVLDPTLANVTDAGVQTAMTFGRPVAAAGMLGAGMLEGVRRDLGMEVSTPAQAQTLTRRQQREQEIRDREAAREREAESSRIRLESEARRTEADAATKRETEAAAERKTREEYDRAVVNAETARDRELGRKRRFSDTELGKVYEKTGGAAPFMAAFGAGAAGRMAHGSNAMGKYIAPAAEGAITGTAVSGLPLLYDAFLTDAENPEKAAYQAYSRELPPSHPRKQEFSEYADKLPSANPVREVAREEFMSPERWIMGGVEGAGLGLTGSTVASAVARPFNAMGRFARGSQAAPQRQTRIIIKDPAGRLRDPDGRFTRSPD